jgi:thiol:disulfide interchange protein DsbD
MTTASSQEPAFQNLLGEPRSASGTAKRARPITFDVQIVPGGKADEVSLRIEAKIPAGHYTYSTNPAFGAATKIKVDEPPALTAIDDGFIADRKPKVERELILADEEQEVEKFYEQVTWTRRYRIEPDVARNAVTVRGSIKTQVCNQTGCMPQPEHKFEVSLANSSPADVTPVVSTNEPARVVTAEGEAPSDAGSTSFRHLVGKRTNPQLGTDWTVSAHPKQVPPGGTITLSVKATIGQGWHIYTLDQPELPDGGGPLPTAIVVEEAGGLKPLGQGFDALPPKVAREKQFGDAELRYYENEAVWTRRFEVPATASPGPIKITGQIGFQICTERVCDFPTGLKFQGQVDVADSVVDAPSLFILAGPLKSSEAKNLIDSVHPKSAAPAPLGRAVPTAVAPAPAALPARANAPNAASGGFVAFLLAAIGAGFVSLLTPCVFPMIPITVSFFLKQSEKEHHKPITMASVYAGGIIATFTVLGFLMSVIFGATSLNTLANNGWLNIGIAIVMVFFGLSLLGMYEIHIPNWLLSFTSEREGRGGLLGTLFMALTFTLTSFTCTFAFVGGVLVMAAKGSWFYPVLGLLAFSWAFSLPFFFLALFPSLLHRMPKGGGWLNAVKVTMGLLEIGAALKFLSVADLVWHPVPWIFDFELVMSAWMVLAIVSGMYLFGLFQLPHDTPLEKIGVLRLMFGIAFCGLAGYLAVGLFAPEKPTGKLWANIVAFAPQRLHVGEPMGRGAEIEIAAAARPAGPVLYHGGLSYALDFNSAREFAKATNRPLFLDFTGVNCANCRYMEKGAMSRPEIVERLRKLVRVQLYADNVPTVTDPELAEMLLEKNRKLQEDWFGSVTLPSYAIVLPDGETVLSKYEGAERVNGEFAKFLDDGFAKWEAQRNGPMVGLARK